MIHIHLDWVSDDHSENGNLAVDAKYESNSSAELMEECFTVVHTIFGMLAEDDPRLAYLFAKGCLSGIPFDLPSFANTDDANEDASSTEDYYKDLVDSDKIFRGIFYSDDNSPNDNE